MDKLMDIFIAVIILIIIVVIVSGHDEAHAPCSAAHELGSWYCSLHPSIPARQFRNYA